MSGTEMHDEHDPALSALYARLPQEEPPAVLDAAILAAARAATTQPPATSPRWGARLALAATLVLSTSVVLMRESGPAPGISDAVVAADARQRSIAHADAEQGSEMQNKVIADVQLPSAPAPAPAPAESPAIAPPAVTEPQRAEMALRAARSERAEVATESPEASSAAAPRSDDISRRIERDVLAGLEAQLTQAGTPSLRWRVRGEASTRLADRLRERLGKAGFLESVVCPGLLWTGEYAGWRVELREMPEGVDVRVVAVGAPCG